MTQQEKIFHFATNMAQAAMQSGLSWDEAVAAFGICAKMLASNASQRGDGTPASCTDHAQKRFQEGLGLDVQVHVVIATSDLTQVKESSSDTAEAVLSNCNIHLRMPSQLKH
jgi:hypothetical protein